MSVIMVHTSGVRLGIRMRLVLRLVREQGLRVSVRVVVVVVEVGLRRRCGRRRGGRVLRRIVLVQGRSRRGCSTSARLAVAVRVRFAGTTCRVATYNKRKYGIKIIV